MMYTVPDMAVKTFTRAEFEALTLEERTSWSALPYLIVERDSDRRGPYTILARQHPAEVTIRRTWGHRLSEWLCADYFNAILRDVQQQRNELEELKAFAAQLCTDFNDLKNKLAEQPQPEQWHSGRPLNTGNSRRHVAERPRNLGA